MTGPTQGVQEQAIGWVIRLRDADADAWEAFTRWLEADPAHGAAYEEAALADAALDTMPAAPRPIALSVEPVRRASTGRRAVIGWGMAAALVAAIGIGTFPRGASTYEVATAAGERRQVALADGSRLDLNGATRLVLDRDDPRFARVEQGEVLFTVVHDSSRPFRVETGAAHIQDLGTVFNVERNPDGSIEVQVAEGAVRFSEGRERVELRPGMGLRKEAGRRAIVGSRSAEAIGGWRDGRLSYSNATISEVAEDLARNMGLEVTADASVAGRRFSGVILLDRDAERVRRRVGALLEVEARRSGSGWLLTAGGDDAH